MFTLLVEPESVGAATATTMMDFKEENILVYLETKKGSSFWCFKGKKTSDLCVFRERRVVDISF